MKTRIFNLIIIDESGSMQSIKKEAKRKRVNANARCKTAKAWDKIAHGVRYREVAAKEFGRRTTLQIKEELFDGILLNLRNEKESAMSYSKQKRVLRRIIEKRQAQQTHRKVGRSGDRFSCHIQRLCICEIRNYQTCA